MSRVSLLAGAALGLLPIAAAAADLPVRTAPPAPMAPVFVQVDRWTGFYAGVGVGLNWRSSRSHIEYGQGDPGFRGDVFGGPAFFHAQGMYRDLIDGVDANVERSRTGFLLDQNQHWDGDRFDRRRSGFVGTLALGYNVQLGTLVLGVEGDVSWTGARRHGDDWRDTQAGAYRVFFPRAHNGMDPPYNGDFMEPDLPPPPSNGLGNLRRYEELGYICTQNPPPPENKFTCEWPKPPGPPTPPPPFLPGTEFVGSYTVATGLNVDSRTSWVSTLRARAGVAAGPFLLYGTGGLAFGETNMTISGFADERFREVVRIEGHAERQTNVRNTYTTWNASRSRNAVGWALGAGAEWALSDNWSVKGEYVYYHLGTTRLTANGVSTTTGTGIDGAIVTNAAPITIRQKFDGHIVRVGLNYRFAAPVRSAAVYAPVVARN